MENSNSNHQVPFSYFSVFCHNILSEEEEEQEVQHYTYNVVAQENGAGDDDNNDDDDSNDDDDDSDDDDDDEMNYILILIAKEIANTGLNDQEISQIINGNWIQEARSHAIHCILRTGQELQFSIQTVYTSVVYLNRFLSTRTINNGLYWAVRLLSMACLSLAAKMDENRVNVPRLSEYSLKNYNFNSGFIRRMEYLVLDVLNWNMNCVTPFSFAKFFVSRFCRKVSRKYHPYIRTLEIIMRVLRDMRLMNQRPSVIAAAATLVAVNKNLNRQELEIYINALPINRFLQIDNVCYCYYKLIDLK